MCWAWGWVLLPRKGVAFGGLTWWGRWGAAGRKPESRAGALRSAPPWAPGGQPWAHCGSLGPAAWAPFPRWVLGALRSGESKSLKMTRQGSMQPLMGTGGQIRGTSQTEKGAPWAHSSYPSHQTNMEPRPESSRHLSKTSQDRPTPLASQPRLGRSSEAHHNSQYWRALNPSVAWVMAKVLPQGP